MLRKIFILITCVAISAILHVIVVYELFELNSTSFEDYFSKNILINSNFKNGFDNWKHDSGVCVTNIRFKSCVFTKNSNNKQTRFWQDVNVVSGKTYRLKFDLKANQNGAFAIFRDDVINSERYKFCDKTNSMYSTYILDVEIKRTGVNTIYLSTKNKGDFFFKNILFLDHEIVDHEKLLIFLTITILSIVLFSLLLLLLFSYNKFFAIIIALFVLIPIIRISKNNNSIVENRNLSQYKHLFIDGKINESYGKDFNDWLNDQFFGRFFWISCNFNIKYEIDRRYETSKAIQGKDGWLFQKLDPNFFLSNSKVDNLITNKMVEFQSKCNELGAKVIFASIPEKNNVYSEYCYYKLPDEFVSKKLSNYSIFDFIFLLNDFKKIKDQDLLFFKDDHHWTEYAAYLYAEEIIKHAKQYYTNLFELNLIDFDISNVKNTYSTSIEHPQFYIKKNYPGSLSRFLNLNFEKYNKRYPSYYKVFNHKTYSVPKTEFSNTRPSYSKYTNNLVNNNLKIMIIGDSNIAFLIPFMTSTFSDCLFLQINGTGNNGWHLYKYMGTIEMYKPNIILVISRSGNIKSWVDLYK